MCPIPLIIRFVLNTPRQQHTTDRHQAHVTRTRTHNTLKTHNTQHTQGPSPFRTAHFDSFLWISHIVPHSPTFSHPHTPHTDKHTHGNTHRTDRHTQHIVHRLCGPKIYVLIQNTLKITIGVGAGVINIAVIFTETCETLAVSERLIDRKMHIGH